MKHLSVFFFALAICACSNDESSGTGEQEVRVAPKKVSGFTFEGPQAAINSNPMAICSFIQEPAVSRACTGETTTVDNCIVLCSKPVAKEGKAAGYTFEGFKILGTDKVPVERCLQVVTPEELACAEAGGEKTRVNDCGTVCSKPIAPKGQVAGYDKETFQILPAAAPEEVCPMNMPYNMACDEVGGQLVRAEGCKQLCSLPHR